MQLAAQLAVSWRHIGHRSWQRSWDAVEGAVEGVVGGFKGGVVNISGTNCRVVRGAVGVAALMAPSVSIFVVQSATL